MSRSVAEDMHRRKIEELSRAMEVGGARGGWTLCSLAEMVTLSAQDVLRLSDEAARHLAHATTTETRSAA